MPGSGGNPFRFPSRKHHPIVYTPAAIDAINTVFDVPTNGGFVVISGVAGAGKTTTGELLLKQVNEVWYSPSDPDTFRAHKLEAGKYRSDDRMADKRAVLAVYNDIIGRMDRSISGPADVAEISTMLIAELRLRCISMLIIDEAGGYTTAAVRGLMTLGNVARQNGHPLVIVLIGMDDLPKVMKSLPQISRRVQEWYFFRPYTPEDTLDFLRKVSPIFEEHTLNDPRCKSEILFIHGVTNGLPGRIVPFLEKAMRMHQALRVPVDLTLLAMVHTIQTQAEAEAIAHSGFGSTDSSGESKRATNPHRRKSERKDQPPASPGAAE
jgi:type II secretory pathway predicted ATPase ExeA